MSETVSIEVGKSEAEFMLKSLRSQKSILANLRLKAIGDNDDELTAVHTAKLESVKTAISTLEVAVEEAPME